MPRVTRSAERRADGGRRLAAGAPALRHLRRGGTPFARILALRHNECVVMLADMVHPGVQAVPVPFFGALASFPLGPARLAQAAGAPILVIASVRESDAA